MDDWTVDCWMLEIWTIGPVDYNLIRMDDHPAHSPSAFFLVQ